jgi:murein L,D-transpeptidase YcbB/YkuD
VKEINSFQKQKENLGKKLASFIKMASKLNIHLINSFQKQKESLGEKLASSIKMASKLNIHLLLPIIKNERLLHKNNASPLWIYKERQKQLTNAAVFETLITYEYFNTPIKICVARFCILLSL